MQRTDQKILSIFNNFTMKDSAYHMLMYLDNQSLENLFAVVNKKEANYINQQNQQYQRKQFKNLIQSFLFIRNYLNKIDRSMFYFIYENKQIQKLDRQSLLYIAENSHNECGQMLNSFKGLFQQLQTKCNMQNEEIEKIKYLVTETDLPLPTSIRSSVGKYCNSTYQMYLCSKNQKNDLAMDQQSCYQSFKNQILQNQETYLRSIFLSAKNSVNGSSLIQKFKELCLNPQIFVKKLSFSNQDYIQGNELYNFLVIVIKLSINLVRSFRLQINSYSDSYSRFIELMLRYTLFKSFILQVDEQFSFFFNNYYEMVQDLLNIKVSPLQSKIPIYKILTNIFVQEMHKQLEQSIPTYLNLVQKFRQTKMENTNQKLENNQSFSMEENQSIVYTHLIDQNQGSNLQTYLLDYVEMFVDLSIDQQNVIWCGHSQHNLAKPYLFLQQKFIQRETQIFKAMVSQQNLIDHHLVQCQLNFMKQKLQIKPKTLKVILLKFNLNAEIDFSKIDNQLSHLNRPNTYEMVSEMKSLTSSAITSASQTGSQAIQFDDQSWEYISEASENQIVEQVDFI